MFIDQIRFLWPYAGKHRYKAAVTILLSFMLAGIKFLQAYLVKPVFDKGLGPDADTGDVYKLALFLLFLGVVNFPCRFYHFYWIRYIVDDITNSIRTELYKKLQKLPTSYFSANKQGTMISSLISDTQIFSSGFKASIDLVREPITAVGMLGLAIYRDLPLTLVIFVTAPLFVWIFGHSGKRVRQYQGIVQEELGHMTHNMSEGLSGQKIIKAFNLRDYVLKRFEMTQSKYFKALMQTTFAEEFAHPMVELIGALAFSGVIVFAHYRIKTGSITAGDFVSFITALALLMDPIRKYSQANVKLNQSAAAAKRIKEIFNIAEEIDQGQIELKRFEKKIVINNVTFSYGHGDVIKNLSLEILKGQKVAFVGLSGSGKSTIINLLLGLFPIEKGSILVDGISLKDIKLKSLRALFGLVNQDIFLFHDSVEENLKIGKNSTDEELKKALEVSYSSSFVQQLPQRHQTLIGDRGARLSGGQQQRITIARAFLHNPEIFLFDEATASLDNESEKIVQKALDNLANDKTVIAVAHRLSTIQNYDKIFVMKEGLLVEQGTHFELISLNGEYAKLYALGSV